MDWTNAIRKIIKNLNVSIAAAGSTRAELVKTMKKEKEILEQFLPKPMSKQDIFSFIEKEKIVINCSLSESKCIGTVIKALRESGVEFNGADVKELVSDIIEKLKK